MRSRSRSAALLVGGVLLAVGCRRTREREEPGEAPPPPPSAHAAVCASGGATPGDPVSAAIFPRVVGAYCIDPNGDTRAFGESAKATLDDVCTQQLDGECELYKSHGLRRVVTLRYVDGAGSPGAIFVTLSRFATREGAFGFYAKRVVADGDPAAITLRELAAGAAATLGSAVAYVYRGEHLAELSYTNEGESPDQMKQSGARILPDVARAIGERLPGEATLPHAVTLLPTEHRFPLGVTVALDDLLGVRGLGGGAVGYYRDGVARYRVAVLPRADEDAADDVLKTLRKLAGASTLKDAGFPAVAFGIQSTESSPRTEWVAGRKGSRVVAVGDEELVLGVGLPRDEEERSKLPRDRKVALLRALVSGA